MPPTSLELTLEEMLADPIVQLVMRRDNILADDVRRVIHEARQAHRIENCNENGESAWCPTPQPMTKAGPSSGDELEEISP